MKVLDCVIGRRCITIQPSPSGRAKNFTLKPLVNSNKCLIGFLIAWQGVVSVPESSADGLFFRRRQVVPIVQRTLELTALGRRKLLPSIVEVLKVSAVLRRHAVQLLHPTPQGFFFLRCQRLPFLEISLEPAVFTVGNQNRHLINIFTLGLEIGGLGYPFAVRFVKCTRPRRLMRIRGRR